jgi:XTP/dITP diphosphohydrolase
MVDRAILSPHAKETVRPADKSSGFEIVALGADSRRGGSVKSIRVAFGVLNLPIYEYTCALMELLFASGNPHKLEEIRATLGPRFAILSLESMGFHEEIPETHPTLEGNALEKARAIHKRFGRDCFADDTGLEIEALGGAPGVFTARFAGVGCTPLDNRAKTLRLLSRVENRKAVFRTVIALILGGNEYLFEGRVEGEITTSEKGVGGFGYDPIFAPRFAAGKTYAELDLATKSQFSHRALAAIQLKKFLESIVLSELLSDVLSETRL